jgi:DNA polymerase III delta subunit
MLEQGKKFTGAELIKIIKLFARAEQEVKSSVLPQMPLELAVAEIISE